MRLRTIRNIISVGAALGFTHGGWGSCSQFLTEFGSAATLPQLISPNQGHVECPRVLLSVVGSQTRCIVRHPLVCRLVADASVGEPALHACNRHPAEGGLVGVGARAAGKQESQRRVPASARRARPHPGILRTRPEALREHIRAEQIAREQVSVNAPAAERIAREQAARDRIVSERIARQQEAANKRTVARIVRQQTEINRRESKRIARVQAARDRLAIERIKRRQAVTDRRAAEALLKRREVVHKVVPDANDKGPGAAARRISKRMRALQIDRIERALRKSASILDRAHLPR